MSLIADVRRITAEYMGKISAQQRLLKEHEKSREVDCFTSLFFQREMVGVPYFAEKGPGACGAV